MNKHHSLLERVRNTDDERAWTEFYDFCWDVVSGWSRALGCPPAIAKDVFQETMMELVKKMPGFEIRSGGGNRGFMAYLKMIVRSRIADHYRREMRNPAAAYAELLGRPDDKGCGRGREAAVDSETESRLDAVWLEGLFRQAVANAAELVRPLTYKSFRMHVLDGLPVDEIARLLNINPRNVHDHKLRTLAAVKRELASLLAEFGCDSMAAEVRGEVGGARFDEAFEAFIRNNAALGATGKFVFPEEFRKRLAFVASTLRRNAYPSESGYFLHVTAPEPPAGGDESSSPLSETQFLSPLSERSLDDEPREAGRRWVRLPGKVSIGRSPSNAVVINSPYVSGIHASLFNKGRLWILQDMRSVNGTYLNGAKISEASLKDGDIIQLSEDSHLIFVVIY